jgi:hypothetical protein
MENKHRIAIEMIAAGYSVEEVMSIVGLEPEELMEVLNQFMGVSAKKIECCVVTQTFLTFVDTFEINMN